MEIALLVIVILILCETTILLLRRQRPARTGRRKIYIDTSALIDGRIVNVARTGFLDGDIVILKSVLLELQLIADSKEADKRSRARAGLTAAAELERVVTVNTDVVDDTGGLKKVDEQLLKYAKEYKGTLLTTDYNLIKVAEAEHIDVLNINDLAIATRGDIMLGERTKIRILEKGSGKGQGVGHLNDGTMVVVEGGAGRIGREVNVELIKIHETSAGRIVFARPVKN